MMMVVAANVTINLIIRYITRFNSSKKYLASCKGQREEFRCECADKVCNEPQIYCIRCMDGCFCKDGFVRDRQNGKCIPVKQCPVAT